MSTCGARSPASKISSSNSRSRPDASVPSSRDASAPKRLECCRGRPTRSAGKVALRYVARAGLLPELSRQTYDSFPKAVREAVLNSLDAEATRVDIDFSQVEISRQMTVIDDGVGMSMRDFCEQFMSLGGSSKFGDGRRFGRIGIGSLALLQYAESATHRNEACGKSNRHAAHGFSIRGTSGVTIGERDSTRWRPDLLRSSRYEGDPADHFTRITLENVNADVWEIGQDPTAFYGLIEGLRRILPLPWSD